MGSGFRVSSWPEVYTIYVYMDLLVFILVIRLHALKSLRQGSTLSRFEV